MPWNAKQHLWKSKAKEGHQLSRGGPSNRQKNDIRIAPFACSVNFKIKWQAKTTGPKNRYYLRFRKKGKHPWVGPFYIHVSATMNEHVI